MAGAITMASITLTIPDDKVTEFREAFLKDCPKPPDKTAMTDTEWIHYWILSVVKAAYIRGRNKRAEEAATYDEDIIS